MTDPASTSTVYVEDTLPDQLDLADSSLGDKGCADLVNQLLPHGDLPSLTGLQLRGNHIKGGGAAALGQLLASPACRLRSLSLECEFVALLARWHWSS